MNKTVLFWRAGRSSGHFTLAGRKGRALKLLMVGLPFGTKLSSIRLKRPSLIPDMGMMFNRKSFGGHQEVGD